MKKRVLSFALMLCLAVGMTICASASEMIEPRFLNVHSSLTFDGTTANCSTMVTSISDNLDVTMTLRRGNTIIDSWSESGISVVSIEGSCRVVKGVTYTLEIEGTRNGVEFNAAPISKLCQ